MKSRPAVVGGFILGALTLVVAGILFFGGSRLFARKERVVVFFSESVAGLDIGSPVTFHGVPIGSVQSIAIRFSPDTMTAQIPVYLELKPDRLILEGGKAGTAVPDYGRLIAAGLRAQLALESFVTGQLRVDLDFRPGTPVRLIGTIKDVPEIPSVPSDISQLRNQLAQLPLHELAETAQQALASFRRLSDHLDSAIDPLAKSVLGTAGAATQTLQTTDSAIRQMQADASTTLHDLDALLVDARSQLDARGGEFGRTIADADRAVRRAETLIDSLNDLAEPRSRFRDDLEAAIRDLSASASALRDFSETLERDPNVILRGRPSQ